MVANNNNITRARTKRRNGIIFRQVNITAVSDPIISANNHHKYKYNQQAHVPIVRIGPHQIAHGSLVGYFLDSVEITRVIQGIDGRRQTSVETEYAIGNDGGHWQVIKGVREVFPDVGVSVFSEAFVVEPIDLGDLTTFVVSP